MSNICDARYRRCDERIQNALLALLAEKPLADISVSELAREANVSRTTFYTHFENITDVFDQLVRKALSEVQTFDEHFSCSAESNDDSNRCTYCEQIRSRGEWSNVTNDPRFFPSMMALDRTGKPITYRSAPLDLTARESEAIRLFQMSGCHAIATSNLAKQRDWEHTRELIDVFIEGGMNAIRSHKASASN